jgi:hypothetical protein
MVHLVLVTRHVSRFLKGAETVEGIEKGLTSYLPYYAVWAAIVSFIFPLIFSFS